MNYKFKTKPYAHQLKALEMSWNKEVFAYFMEMGTGKSKVLIDNISMLYDKGKINAALIIAPKGVYKNWHEGEIPDHLKTKKFGQKVLNKKWPNRKPNITITSLPDDYVHFAQPRSLTVRECARLQTFPDWYIFAGKRTTGGLRRAGNPKAGLFDRELPKYTQIGNAVPVWLAEAIGCHFQKVLSSAEEEK